MDDIVSISMYTEFEKLTEHVDKKMSAADVFRPAAGGSSTKGSPARKAPLFQASEEGNVVEGGGKIICGKYEEENGAKQKTSPPIEITPSSMDAFFRFLLQKIQKLL